MNSWYPEMALGQPIHLPKEPMKIRRYELTNAADGWPCHVVRVDREQGGVIVRTWSTQGRTLQPTPERNLILPGTNTLFILPDDGKES